MSKAILTRKLITVNTDPQRRCYNGCNFSEAQVWTQWAVIEREEWMRPGVDMNKRLEFWRDLNAYSISVGGSKSEYKLEEMGDGN